MIANEFGKLRQPGRLEVQITSSHFLVIVAKSIFFGTAIQLEHFSDNENIKLTFLLRSGFCDNQKKCFNSSRFVYLPSAVPSHHNGFFIGRIQRTEGFYKLRPRIFWILIFSEPHCLASLRYSFNGSIYT